MNPSSPTYSNAYTQLLPKEEEPSHSARIFRPKGRRTTSFSSSLRSISWDSTIRSSSFSYSEECPPFSPGSTPLKFKGVPFSWEQIPGIPKHHASKKDSSTHLLPLPPAGTTTTTSSSTKKARVLHHEMISPKKSNRFQRDQDPFFAAFVECSKDIGGGGGNDDEEHGSNSGNFLKGSSKISRSLSDRFGMINMYTSCKTTCAVSKSIVTLPRKSSHYIVDRRSSYVQVPTRSESIDN